MIKVYCYERCSTCKKAIAWLDANEYKYEMIDIKSCNPSEEILRSLQEKSGLPLKRFFNTSGILYRQMNLTEKLKTISDDEQFELLATDGMLVKRPILITDSDVCVGFRENEWMAAMGKM